MTAGRFLLHALERAGNVDGRDVERLHPYRIDVDLHFALHAADAFEASDAGHARARLAQPYRR